MRRIMIGLVFALTTVGTPLAAQEKGGFDIRSGNGFLKICSSEIDASNAFRLGVCFGYLDGWLERDSAFEHQKLICRPPGVSNRQAMDVVLKYLRDNPQNRHEPMATHFLNSLRAAFPCRPWEKYQRK